MALGGRHLIGRYNNQIVVNGRGRIDVGEEVHGDWSVWGGSVQLFEVTNSNDEKKIENTLLPLDGRRLTTAHITTNQKQASATEESIERMCASREARGEANTIVLGVIEWEDK